MLHVHVLRNCTYYCKNSSQVLKWCKRALSSGMQCNGVVAWESSLQQRRGYNVLPGKFCHAQCANSLVGFEQRRFSSSKPDVPLEEMTIYVPLLDELAYEFVDYIHLSSNLPWWLTIIASTVAMRTLLHLPLGIMTQRVRAKMENIQPKINGHVEVLRQNLEIEAKEKKWRESYKAKEYEKGVRQIVAYYYSLERCHPVKFLMPVIGHVAAWSGMTIALGQMSGGKKEIFGTEMDVDFIPEFCNQGALWFSNLTVADPVLILPVLFYISNMVLIELWNLQRGPETRTQRRLKIFLRGVSTVMLPAAVIMPASIQLFWLTSSLCGIGQFILLKQPVVRESLGIPKSPSEMTKPMKEMKQIFKARYFSKKIF
ncbi:cytochrome c oxidase assembly protein COX18, mitochondrial-like [Ptychodera flava]|uniref:cytochrome c oxidase assembly protein COX18, mitochondrial-like n=1 Tax=Ptychodera flava TaxID=63121 RepID=UPI00396A8A2E